MDWILSCLFVLKNKGCVTRNNLRLAFHLSEEQIETLIAYELIRCVHKKENKMDDDYFEITDKGIDYLEGERT